MNYSELISSRCCCLSEWSETASCLLDKGQRNFWGSWAFPAVESQLQGASWRSSATGLSALHNSYRTSNNKNHNETTPVDKIRTQKLGNPKTKEQSSAGRQDLAVRPGTLQHIPGRTRSHSQVGLSCHQCFRLIKLIQWSLRSLRHFAGASSPLWPESISLPRTSQMHPTPEKKTTKLCLNMQPGSQSRLSMSSNAKHQLSVFSESPALLDRNDPTQQLLEERHECSEISHIIEWLCFCRINFLSVQSTPFPKVEKQRIPKTFHVDAFQPSCQAVPPLRRLLSFCQCPET